MTKEKEKKKKEKTKRKKKINNTKQTCKEKERMGSKAVLGAYAGVGSVPHWLPGVSDVFACAGSSVASQAGRQTYHSQLRLWRVVSVDP